MDLNKRKNCKMKYIITAALLLFMTGCDNIMANNCIGSCNYKLCTYFSPVVCAEPQHERCVKACVDVYKGKLKTSD